MPKYQPLAAVAATALLAASYTQRARNEDSGAATPVQASSNVTASSGSRDGRTWLSPYADEEYSEDAARRIGQAFARLGMESDSFGILQRVRSATRPAS